MAELFMVFVVVAAAVVVVIDGECACVDASTTCILRAMAISKLFLRLRCPRNSAFRCLVVRCLRAMVHQMMTMRPRLLSFLNLSGAA